MSANKRKTQSWRKYRLVAASLAVFLLFASVISLVVPAKQAYAVGSMYLSPASPSVVHDGTVNLTLRISPNTAVTVVEATVNFNPASLQYVGINTSSSPFDTSIQQTVSSNNIKIARAKLDANGISSDSLIAVISFKAIPYSGTSPVTLSAANAAFNGSYTNPGLVNATVSFTAGSCAAGQTGTPPNCVTPAPTPTTPTPTTPPKTTTPTTPPKTTTPTTPTPTTNPTPTTTPTPTAPNTSGLEAPSVTSEDIQYTKVAISATTNIAARAHLVYGTTQDALNTQSAASESGLAHVLTVSEGLTPGMQLFYKVVATDGSITKETEVRSITLKGMTVKIALLDKDLKPIANQKVTLEPSGQEATSDADGFVTFTNVVPGDFTVKITNGGQSFQQHITVASNVDAAVEGAQTSAEQAQAAVFDDYVAPSGLPLWVWLAGGGIILAALAGLAFWSWHKNGFVRDIYVKFRDASVNRKMKGAVAGQFAPTTGLAPNPETPLGSTEPTLPDSTAPLTPASSDPVALTPEPPVAPVEPAQFGPTPPPPVDLGELQAPIEDSFKTDPITGVSPESVTVQTQPTPVAPTATPPT
ncbi:MAG: cohesin domain-containing protein, partial [Candidatus Microsaccharimonas sp.]